MADVFVSYSRRDEAFVRELVRALEERDRDVWRDKDDIPPAVPWEDEIRRGIDSSDVFVFVLSPDSLASTHCRDELEHALGRNKAILPLVRRDPDGAVVPEELARLNYVFARDGDDLGAAVGALLATLDGLPEHVRLHTRVLARAAEWEADARDPGRLLSGRELRDAEDWLAQGAAKEPPPTPLQHEYVLASRSRAARRQRVLVALALAAAAVTAVLAVVALLQRNEAQRQRDEAVRQARIATSRALAAQAATALEQRVDLGTLLALESFAAASTFEARDALVTAVQQTERLDWIVPVTATALALSPDGRTLLTGRPDGTVVAWDLRNRRGGGEPIRVAARPVSRLVFAPDGSTFAVAHEGEAAVTLWDVDGRRVGGFGEAADADVAFSPDGQTAAVVSGSRITLWDVRRGEPLRRVGRFPTTGEVAFSPDGKMLASTDVLDHRFSPSAAVVRLWSVDAGTQLGEPLSLGAPGHAPSRIAFSPDGRLLAAATLGDDLGNPGVLKVWDVRRRAALDEAVTAAAGGVAGVAFGADGSTLVAAADRVRAWSVSGSALAERVGDRFKASTVQFTDVAVGPGGEVVALRADGSVGVSSLESAWALGEPLALDSEAAALSADGTALASADGESAIALWELGSGRRVRGEVDGGEDLVAVALAPGGGTLAGGGWDGRISLWDVASRRPRGEPLPVGAELDALVFGPHDDAVAAVDLEGRASLVPLDGGRAETLPAAGVSAVAFAPSGETVVLGGDDGTLTFVDVPARPRPGDPIAAHAGPVAGIAVSPDGRTLASAGEQDGVIRLWDLGSRRPLGAAVKVADPGLSSVAFSADGRTLAVGIRNLGFVLWDVAERRPVGRPLRTDEYAPVRLGAPNPDLTTWVAFGGNGRTLASRAGRVLILWRPILWSRDGGPFRARLCALVGRNLTADEWRTFRPGVPYRRTCPQWPGGA